MNRPDKIIIHHSATKDGVTHKDFDAIRNYHINTNKWRDIGYHWVVESVNGQYEIIKGRDEKDTGAHTIGYNGTSIGICLVGDFTTSPPPDAQLQTLVYLIKDIYSRWGELPIYGHRDYANTFCPGKAFDLEKVKKMVGDSKVEVKTAEQALDVLQREGILQNKDYWMKAVDVVGYFRELLINIANYIEKN